MERLDEIAGRVRDQQARSLPIELSHSDANWLLQKIAVLVKDEQTRQEIITAQRLELDKRKARIDLLEGDRKFDDLYERTLELATQRQHQIQLLKQQLQSMTTERNHAQEMAAELKVEGQQEVGRLREELRGRVGSLDINAARMVTEADRQARVIKDLREQLSDRTEALDAALGRAVEVEEQRKQRVAEVGRLREVLSERADTYDISAARLVSIEVEQKQKIEQLTNQLRDRTEALDTAVAHAAEVEAQQKQRIEQLSGALEGRTTSYDAVASRMVVQVDQQAQEIKQLSEALQQLEFPVLTPDQRHLCAVCIANPHAAGCWLQALIHAGE